jgi:hypothetical protein
MFKYQHVSQGLCVYTHTLHTHTTHAQKQRHMYIYRRAPTHKHTYTYTHTHMYLCNVCIYVYRRTALVHRGLSACGESLRRGRAGRRVPPRRVLLHHATPRRRVDEHHTALQTFQQAQILESILYIASSYSKYARALTCESFCFKLCRQSRQPGAQSGACQRVCGLRALGGLPTLLLHIRDHSQFGGAHVTALGARSDSAACRDAL